MVIRRILAIVIFVLSLSLLYFPISKDYMGYSSALVNIPVFIASQFAFVFFILRMKEEKKRKILKKDYKYFLVLWYILFVANLILVLISMTDLIMRSDKLFFPNFFLRYFFVLLVVVEKNIMLCILLGISTYLTVINFIKKTEIIVFAYNSLLVVILNSLFWNIYFGGVG